MGFEVGVDCFVGSENPKTIRMGGHHAEAFLAIVIENKAEWKEAADERPVGMDCTSLRPKKHTASVWLSAKYPLVLAFNAFAAEFLGRQADAASETLGFVGRNRDFFIVTAGTAYLALKRKQALSLEVKKERGRKAAFIHFFSP